MKQTIKEANDRITYMTELSRCLQKLEERGFTEQFQVHDSQLFSPGGDKSFLPSEISAVNFYRFEGISDPSDMSIMYAIETYDGRKGTLIDAYGVYANEEVSSFMQHVEIQKKTRQMQWY